jgi:hypothetical protein
MKDKQNNIKIRLKNSQAFQKYLKLKAAEKAFKLKLDNLAKEAGLPESKKFKKDCRGFLVDGNNNPIGKFSVFKKPSFEMPACWVCRIS